MQITSPQPLTTDNPAADLRRRREADYCEMLLHRARFLQPSERSILKALLAEGRTAAQIAKTRNRSPRAVRTHLRAICQRLLSPQFEFVTRHIDEWPPARRRVARACVLQGHSMRDAASRLGLSIHVVRRHLDLVLELAERDLTPLTQDAAA